MPKHQIFIVHGMGQYTADWSKSTVEILQKQFGAYPMAKALEMDTAFEFAEINYSTVFDKWREQWANDAQTKSNQLLEGGLSGGVIDELNNAASVASGDHFFQTHVLDVLFFRFIAQMAEEVTLEVLTQMDKHLSKFGHDPVDYSIVCHSLGTSVAYQALHAGLSDPNSLLRSRLPVNFISVANCAKLLWGRRGDVFTPTMGPSSFSHRGMCDRFLNFGHELDPVWQVDAFHAPPDRWFWEPAQRALTYQHALLPAEDVQKENIHSLSHYLSHPLVHVPIIHALAKSPNVVTAKQLNKALIDWRQQRLQLQALNKVKAQYRALGKPASDDWKAIGRMLVGLRQYLATLPKEDGEN